MAGEEAGLGHLSGRRQGLPSARRPLPSLRRSRAAGWAAGGAGGPGRSRAWRTARAGSLPPPRRFSAAAAPQPGSGGSAPPRLPPLPEAGRGGARRGSRGRRVRGQRPSPSFRDLCLAWASPARCSFFPSSFGVLFGGRSGQYLLPRGVPFGVTRPVRGACVPIHPVAVSFAGVRTEAAVPCGRVAVLCVLHPAHVVGCSLPPSIFSAGEEGG